MENGAQGMTSRVAVLLERMRQGEPAALDELMPLVYGELRRIAQSFFRSQRPGHTLQPTALVNEAFLKLFDAAHPAFSDRAHFLSVMARAMRQVLVDHARALGTAKRGGGGRVQWDTNFEVQANGGSRQLKVLEVHSALEALARENGALAQVIEMHYFGGMTAEEAAVAAGRSVHVVRRELRLARAWMRRELAG
jgi:RNA polymerase sigma factor (TIGR02999 family)